MNSFTKRATALVAVSLLAFSACGTDGDSSSPSDTIAPTEATEAPGSGEPFKIGLVTSMTGNFQFLGAPSEAGVQAAVAVLNASGGVNGRQVEYVLCDDETSPEKARACFERLTQNDDVDVLVGFPLAAATEAVAPLVAAAAIPTWILGGSYGGRNLNDQQYLLSGLPVTEDALQATFAWAAGQGFETAWILATDDATGEPCVNWGDQPADLRSGIEVVGTNTMQAGAQTAAPQLAAISADADFTFLCVSGGAGVVAAVGYVQSGLEAPAVAIHSQGAAFIAGAMAGKVGNNTLYVPSFCTLGVTTGELSDEYQCVANARKFVETLAEVAPGVSPDYLAAHAYDGAMLLAEAAAATDGSGTAIIDYITSLDEISASLGIYTFTEKIRRGIGPDQLLMGLFEDGNWIMIDPLQLPKL